MSNNQFDFMQNFMNPENFMKSMKNMPMPGADLSNMSNIMKETSEAFASSGQMATESMQSIMKRGADSFQKNTTELFNSMKDAVSAGNVEQIVSCQQKYLKNSMENNLNNTKEAIEMGSKSAMEILDVMGKNLGENINKAFSKPKK